jgi:hypothetical protein
VIRAFAVAAVALTASVAAAGPRAHGEDAYDTPTDTGVALVVGLWHDDVLKPGAGWHLYHFTAVSTGWVAFQMRAPVDRLDHSTVWSYLRVVDGKRSWASVGNRKTNLCELIIPVVAGRRYDVIATSQSTASLARGEPQTSDGPYTIGVMPVETR